MPRVGDQHRKISLLLQEFFIGWMVNSRKGYVDLMLYQTNALPKDTPGRKPKKNVDDWLEPPHDLNLPISLPKLVECTSLLLKNCELRQKNYRVGAWQ
jgi:hypothetical protein